MTDNAVTAVPGAKVSLEVVPLTQRVAAMAALRMLIAITAVVLAVRVDAMTSTDVAWLVSYVAITALLSLGSLLRHRVATVRMFGTAMLLDAVMVQYVHQQLGHEVGTDVLIAVQLIGACLLGSFRIGTKLALWQSLLFLFCWQAEATRLFSVGPLTGPDRPTVVALDIIAMWLVVLITSTAAAINERELRRRRYDAEALERLASAFISDDQPNVVAHRLMQFLTEELALSRAIVISRTIRDDAVPAQDRPAAADGESVTRLIARTPTVPALSASDAARYVPSALLDAARSLNGSALTLRLNPSTDPVLAELLPGARKVAAIPLGQLDAAGCQRVLVCEFARSTWAGGRVERRTLTTAMQAAATAALALSRAELMQRAQRAAVTDAMTGLGNRRALDLAMAQADVDWRESGTPVALILVDIDHFKSVNDRFGHPVGDEVIKNVVGALERCAPRDASICRHGGEEFVMLLPTADARSASIVAERIRRTLHGITEPVPVTASLGIAAVPQDCAAVAELFGIADEALLHAKASGRDRVVLASDLHIPVSDLVG